MRKKTIIYFIGVTISVFAQIIVSQNLANAASINAGGRAANPNKPFIATAIAEFNLPWAIAFLPDGQMLITEKPGHIYLVSQNGKKIEFSNVPNVLASGQNGMLDIAVSPDYNKTQHIYFSFVAPDGGGQLTLMQAKLTYNSQSASFSDLKEIWRQQPAGGGGQPGGIIAFDPQGQHLYLSVGERMQPQSAQDDTMARGKVLRMNLDGTVPSDNPHASQAGVQALTWTTGHRNPYGLAFAADGKLWLIEMGPRGGDELNRIEMGKNYGWPIVSNGSQYSGAAIPDHDTRPEFAAPIIYWNPVISPAGLAFYQGNLFPQWQKWQKWQNTAFIGGLSSRALIHIGFDDNGGADEIERFDMEARIRDVAVAPDGALWLIEDSQRGRLLRLTPK